MFQYALVVSMIILTVFNGLWGKRLYGLKIISLLVWSILMTVYFIFLWLGSNYWQLTLLGIPCQLIVLLCFFIKRRGKYVFASNAK